jgi:site-specific DNA-methyltransferase (adenine-specific)
VTARILVGDCLDVLPTLALSSVDSIVTDPPYELGFMGKAWDRSGVAFRSITWAHALRVIRPGGYLLAFGGTRTFHRLTCAIEDAGWEIHDALSWLYGSGFPKHASKLKPAWEPIVLARRPSDEATPLNIDACRLPVADAQYAKNCSGDRGHAGTRESGEATDMRMGGGSAHDRGRWPANVVIDEIAAESIDAQSGELTSGANPARRSTDKTRNTFGRFPVQEICRPARGIDVGGASRFYYCAKASRKERELGLDEGFDRKPLNWSSGEQSPGTFQSAGTNRDVRNHHPTVKPIALMQWLVRLVTPDGGTVLDPFMGSGSTGCAAALEGRSFIGIEANPEYAEIARARIAVHAQTPDENAAPPGEHPGLEATSLGRCTLKNVEASA